MDGLAQLVRKFLRQFRPEDCWEMTYATSCSKPRIGEFAGGAVFVTAKAIRWLDAWEFLNQERTVFEAAKGAPAIAGKTRPIEMYVGVLRGDAPDWYTTDVGIPAGTPEEVVERVAVAVLERRLAANGQQAAFCGVYNTRDDAIADDDDGPTEDEGQEDA